VFELFRREPVAPPFAVDSRVVDEAAHIARRAKRLIDTLRSLQLLA
jgi:hypothetical protein